MSMKKLRNNLTILLCMTLFQSSCDLLSDTEAKVMDYVKVQANINIKVQAWRREFDQVYLSPAPLAVQVKIYSENVKSSKQEVMLDREISMEEMKTGLYQFSLEPSYIHEGEVFTASVYLVDFPAVYDTETLSYQNAKELKIKTMLGEELISHWNIFFDLVKPLE